MNQNQIESLAIEIYKSQAGLTPPVMSNLSVAREDKDNLRSFQALESSYCVKSVQIRSYFWWSVFSCTRTRNNSVFGHFSRSDLNEQ